MKQHVCLPYSHCVSLYLIMCNWTCAFFKIMLSQNMIHEYKGQEHLIFYVTMYVPRCKTKLQSSLTLLLKLKCFLPLLFIFTNNRVENFVLLLLELILHKYDLCKPNARKTHVQKWLLWQLCMFMHMPKVKIWYCLLAILTPRLQTFITWQ